MSKNRSMSVRLSPDLNKQVADIARALDRPESWVIEQAIKDFVAVQACISLRLTKGSETPTQDASWRMTTWPRGCAPGASRMSCRCLNASSLDGAGPARPCLAAGLHRPGQTRRGRAPGRAHPRGGSQTCTVSGERTTLPRDKQDEHRQSSTEYKVAARDIAG